MTGSEQGGVLFGMGGIALVSIGAVMLLIGVLAAFVWAVQWWFFLPGGVCFTLGVLGIALLFYGERKRSAS